MDGNKSIAGLTIGIILLFYWGFIIIPSIMGTHDNSYSTSDNSSTNSSENLTFDNSTPEALAISIARLNEGSNGFEYVTVDWCFFDF